MSRTTTSFTQSGHEGGQVNLAQLRLVFVNREKEIRRRIRDRHSTHLDFLQKRGFNFDNIREISGRKVAATALAGALVFNPLTGPGSSPAPHPKLTGQTTELTSTEDTTSKLAQALKGAVPAGFDNLSTAQEQQVTQAIQTTLHVKATTDLEGHRLNRSFGLIGAEQHLYRYPGDNIFDQEATPTDFAMYGGSGIAPGLGAYGYFAPSKEAMTEQDVQREKWYVVAQTFLAPGFNNNPKSNYDFYKYRKFIVINPDTGQAVVGDLADAGPAEYTGKSFGGSPEVMHFLGYGGGPRKGRVIFFFVDDPKNQIPLGPIQAPAGVSK